MKNFIIFRETLQHERRKPSPNAPCLAGAFASNKKKKAAISRHLGISDKSFSNKMSGRSPFTLCEATAIQHHFFPDVSIDVLFAKDGDDFAS